MLRFLPITLVFLLSGCMWWLQESVTEEMHKRTPEQLEEYIADQPDESLCFIDKFGDYFDREDLYDVIYKEMLHRNMSPSDCKDDGTLKKKD